MIPRQTVRDIKRTEMGTEKELRWNREKLRRAEKNKDELWCYIMLNCANQMSALVTNLRTEN